MNPEVLTQGQTFNNQSAGAIAVDDDSRQFGQSESVNLMFVDSAVDDIDSLISQVARNTQVILLDSNSDGISQITDALSQFDNVASLNVVSHGEAGQLQLGSSTITSSDLADYSSQLESWQGSLTQDADILFYGCNVAAGAKGSQFLSEFGELTGADIAASSDLTGSSQLGGDWDLEYASGDIETTSPFASSIEQNYGSVLQTQGSSGPVFSGKNGRVVLEAESAQLNGGWIRTNIANRTALLYNGENIKQASAEQQVEYRFKTDQSGQYFIAMYGARKNSIVEDFENDRGNDLFVTVVNADNGKIVQKPTKFATFFGPSNLTYKWGNTFSANHQRKAATVNLQAGTEYQLLLSGRSRGYAVDRITLGKDKLFRDTDAPQSQRLTGSGGNDKPISSQSNPTANNDAFTTKEDTRLNGNVLKGAGADRAGSGSIKVVSNTKTSNGSLTIQENGNFTYTPKANFFGKDSFKYTIRNSSGGTDTATVSLTVQDVNDRPSAKNIPGQKSTDGSQVDLDLSSYFSDRDGTIASYSTRGLPKGLSINKDGIISGTLASNASDANNNNDGTQTYNVTVTAVDNDGASVNKTFKYTVDNIDPVAVNDTFSSNEGRPVWGNVLKGRGADRDGGTDTDKLSITSYSDPANGTISLRQDGSFKYTPNANFEGVDTFTYTVADGNGGIDTATVSVTVDRIDPVIPEPTPTPEPTPAPTPAPAPSSFRVEAESLQLKGYRLESNSFASGGKLIGLRGGKANETASATYVHKGDAGNFDIDLRYFDENDGASRMVVKLNGKEIDRWTLNAKTNGTNVSEGTSRIRSLKDITLAAGDRLEIVGTENQREHVRFDYLDFKTIAPEPAPPIQPTPIDTAPIRVEAEDLQLSNYRVEQSSFASGGKILSLRGKNRTETGRATYTHSGDSGTYRLDLSYFDENDGASTIRVLVNGKQVDRWTLDEDPDGPPVSAATNRIRNVGELKLNKGDRITIVGGENAGEHARIDYLELIPSLGKALVA